MPNNDPTTLETLLAALPDVRARLTEVPLCRVHIRKFDGQPILGDDVTDDVRSLIALVDALLAEKKQEQPTKLTELDHDAILNHVEHMVSEQYAKDSPMYNGEGFEVELGELVELGRIQKRVDDNGYYYYLPSASATNGGDA